MGAIEAVAFILIAIAVLEIAAWRWGHDSTDGIDSPEWERRHQWSATRQ